MRKCVFCLMKISVYITSYNQKRYLKEAIESVLAQTLKPCQIIIADDCSSDGSQEVIAGFHSQHPDLITPIYHTQNTGVTQIRVDALQVVTGDYVTYVDGDDRFLPTKLEKEAKLLQASSHAQIAFSNNFYMTMDGVHTGIWANETRPPEGDIFCQTFARDFPKRNLFRMELVDYQAWKRVGYYDPNLQIYEDYDMRIRLTKYLQAVYYDEPLTEIRRCNTGLSSSKSERHFEALDYIYQKNKSLLADLGDADREYVNRKFGEWIAGVATRASEEALNEGRSHQAAKLFLNAWHYDPAVYVEQLQRKKEQLERQDERLQQQAEQLERQNEQLKRQNEQIRQQSERLKRLGEQLRQQSERMEQLATECRNLNLQLSQLQNSWSWQITKPLRKVNATLRRLKK
jgi:glycosyltransferase involved in cell wall biosynthesis